MNRYVDFDLEAMVGLMKTTRQGMAFRIMKGVPEEAAIVDVTYIRSQNRVRFHLNCEAEDITYMQVPA